MKTSTNSPWLAPATTLTLVVAALAAASSIAMSPPSRRAAFAADNDAAMTRMMAGMHIRPTADIDRDFATMMIVHHRGAIEMAEAELRYGADPRLLRLAQEIVVTQRQEIVVMQKAIDDLAAAPQRDVGASSAQGHRHE